MTDRDALIAAVAAAPADDLPRLVFADWLEENGDPPQAAFVRGHVELARLPRGPKRAALAAELRAAAVRHAAGWVAPLCAAFDQPAPTWPPDATGFRRLWNPGATADALRLRPYLRDDGALAVPCAAWDGRVRGAVPLVDVRYHRGAAEHLRVAAGAVRDAGQFGRAFRAAPVADLALDLTAADPLFWAAVDGPWFARLRSLALSAAGAGTLRTTPRLLAGPVFRSPNLSGLRAVTLRVPAYDEDGTTPLDPTVVEELARSPLAGRLRVLRVPYTPEVVRALRAYPAGGPLDELCPAAASGRNMLPDGWRGLADLPIRPRLRRLSLRACGLTDAGLAALARGPRWEGLVALRLDANLLTDAGGVALARLAPFPRLRALRLDRNRLGDDTARALARSPLARTLHHLDLSHNGVTADGALPLAVACAEGPLRRLRLGGNLIPRRWRRRIRDILRDRVQLDP